MSKNRSFLACLVLFLFVLSASLEFISALAPSAFPPLAAGTFPVGTIVVPMDSKQADRVRVYGLIHEFLRSGDVEVARIIEPPDVTMQTALTPNGAVYQGGPFLIEQKFLPQLNTLLSTSNFNKVTVTRLTASFTSNQIFFVRQATRILVIKGIWGRTDFTLSQMAINYTLVNPDDVLKNPSLIDQYTLVVLDCPGWFGSPSTFTAEKRAKIQAVYDKLRTRVQAGNEVIFTDIAMKDLNATFPGYIRLLGPNPPGTWQSTMHNPPAPAGTFPGEFPSQYFNPGPNPNNITIFTEGSGYTVASVEPAHASDVRIIADTDEFGIPARSAILGFYFQFGNGIVEGLAFHPQQQLPVGSARYFAVLQMYGNKFVHGPQIDFTLSAQPESATINQGQTANYTVTVQSIGGFSSNVNLQVSPPAPGVPGNATASFSPSSVTPPAGSSATSTLRVATTFSTRNGTYSLTITGSSTLPAITRRINVTLIVRLTAPDFIIDVTPRPPAFLVVNVTQCNNASVSVRSIGNFSSPINLTLTNVPSRVTFEYFPKVVRPAVGATVFSVLRICAPGDATPGNYTGVVISGTSVLPTITHTANLNLRIQSVGPNPLVYLLALLMLLIALGIALLAFFLSRKRAVRAAPVVAPVMRVRAARPRVLRVMPLPLVRCRYCGRIMPLYAVYCPHCGRPQVVLARPPPRLVTPRRVTGRGIVGFALSLVAGILVLLNSVALLSPGFYAVWSGIFFWLPTIGPSYAFALGFIIGLVLIFGAIIMVLGQGALADIIILPFAVFSLFIGGGFVAGMLLGVIGGIIGALRR